MTCANIREISRCFLHKSLRLRIFVRGVNAKKEFFFLGLICILIYRTEFSLNFKRFLLQSTALFSVGVHPTEQ